MHPRMVASLLLAAAGVTAVVTAMGGYFTRYSRFDSLYGEIDPTLYARITTMTGFERAAILAGLIAVLLGCALAAAHLIRAGRTGARTPAGVPRP